MKSYDEHDAQVLYFMGKQENGRFFTEKFEGQYVSNDLRGTTVGCVCMYEESRCG